MYLKDFERDLTLDFPGRFASSGLGEKVGENPGPATELAKRYASLF